MKIWLPLKIRSFRIVESFIYKTIKCKCNWNGNPTYCTIK